MEKKRHILDRRAATILRVVSGTRNRAISQRLIIDRRVPAEAIAAITSSSILDGTVLACAGSGIGSAGAAAAVFSTGFPCQVVLVGEALAENQMETIFKPLFFETAQVIPVGDGLVIGKLRASQHVCLLQDGK